MKVVVAVPWRPTPERQLAFDLTFDWMSRVLPGAESVEVDTDHEVFNLAACRNLGVREAEARGADVVVLRDADVVISPNSAVIEALAAAAADGRAHLPFSSQRYLTARQTTQLAEGYPAHRFRGVGPGNGCCYVLRPEAYWRMGGSDERFSGWGGDDDSFVAAAATLIGLKRHAGVALSLHHADECRDVGSERHRPNSQLAARYWEAKGNEAAMRSLIAERSQPSI